MLFRSSNLGLALFELGKEAEAEARYSRALELDPGHPEAANNLGVVKFSRKQYDEARALFARAVMSRADYLDAWFNLRDACAELGLDDERRHAALMVERLERTGR